MLQPVGCGRSQWLGMPCDGFVLQGDVAECAPALLSEYAGRVQTVYLDPPFNTGKRFEMRAKAGGKTVVTEAYDDRHESREAYLSMIRSALLLSRGLLREEGTIFLHCDGRMNARLRLMMDEVFGEAAFLNEIVWVYQSGGRSRAYFPRKHDTILFYARSRKYEFNLKAVPVGTNAERRNHLRREIDEEGRAYRAVRSGGKEYRYYDDEPVYPGDVWTDISHLQQRDPERTGFETQKPVALLRRILLSASKEGDLVCDLFSGSGTTAAAAASLGRRFLCLDRSPLAVSLTEGRLDPGDGRAPRRGYAVQAPAALDGAAEAFYCPAIASYTVFLTDFRCPRAEAEGIPGMDALSEIAVGFLREGVFHACVSSRRTKKQAPATQLEVPVYGGEPCVRVTDVWGDRRFFMPVRRI